MAARFIIRGSRACALLAVAVALGACALVALPRTTYAQTATQPTAIAVAAPPSAQLGQEVTVKAKLVDAQGRALPHVTVDFTSPATFLNHTGDMVVATAVTDAQGVATGQFQARRDGAITVKAVFAGNANYARSQASTSLTIAGTAQLYDPSVIPSVPVLNASPFGSFGMTNSGTRWLLTGWPIGAVLLLVWSSYGFAVFFMSRIAAAAEVAPGDAALEQGAAR